MLEGIGVVGGAGQRGKNWDNCNSINNKIYLKKRRPLLFVTPHSAVRTSVQLVRRASGPRHSCSAGGNAFVEKRNFLGLSTLF